MSIPILLIALISASNPDHRILNLEAIPFKSLKHCKAEEVRLAKLWAGKYEQVLVRCVEKTVREGVEQ